MLTSQAAILDQNGDTSQISKKNANEKTDGMQRRVDQFDENEGWQPALITAEEPNTADFVVSATQTFGEEDVGGIDRKNDWKSIETDGIVQSPILQVQRQFLVDHGTGKESDRPYFEPWVQRERYTSTTRPTLTSTVRNNKAYRKPYSIARRNEELKTSQFQMNDDGKSVNLRSILKQTGGLSLSEILQEQNLSLDDLLKGKQNAIRAIQNTAAPPFESKDNTASKPSTRRLPSLGQLNILKPRRTFFNGTTRANLNRSEQNSAPTQRTDDVSNEMVSTEKKGVSTIPTFFADIPSTHESNNGKRLPSSRGKPIKEVVSAIRPDLNNSNLRKRMPNLKSLQSKYIPQVASTIETAVKFNKTETDNSDDIRNVNIETVDEKHLLVSSTTETSSPQTSPPTENSKPNVRERSPLRPPRLRNTFTPTEITSAQSSIDVSSTRATASTEERVPYTIITFPTQNDQNDSLLNDFRENAEPIDDVNIKLKESAPELNLVDLEDESKSKEVTSLEDLFISDNMDSGGNSGESESEFLHASSTSRSDSLFKSEKPNSLKMFGGNLVSIFKKTLESLEVTERNPALFTDVTARYIDDRTELMDLLSDRRNGARLVKVLRQRNMTVDELIEHRKRGSSQIHLAEIFYNSSRSEPLSPSASPQSQPDKLDVVTAFKNFPDFELDNVKSVSPDEIKTDSQGSSYFTSITNIQPTVEVNKEGRAIRKPFIIKLAESVTKQNATTQHWHNGNGDLSSSNQNFEGNFPENSSQGTAIFASRHGMRPSTGDENNVNAFHDIVDQNRNDAAARSHDPLDLELSGHGYKRNSVLIENAQTPIGVRSAIVASASIVLISLTIFLIIFLVCRWRQKRKRKICYSDRFQALRGRLPIFSSPVSKRSTSPQIQSYCPAQNSSRRSSKLNTMDPNSPEVQEYLYDAMDRRNRH